MYAWVTAVMSWYTVCLACLVLLCLLLVFARWVRRNIPSRTERIRRPDTPRVDRERVATPSTRLPDPSFHSLATPSVHNRLAAHWAMPGIHVTYNNMNREQDQAVVDWPLVSTPGVLSPHHLWTIVHHIQQHIKKDTPVPKVFTHWGENLRDTYTLSMATAGEIQPLVRHCILTMSHRAAALPQLVPGFDVVDEHTLPAYIRQHTFRHSQPDAACKLMIVYLEYDSKEKNQGQGCEPSVSLRFPRLCTSDPHAAPWMPDRDAAPHIEEEGQGQGQKQRHCQDTVVLHRPGDACVVRLKQPTGQVDFRVGTCEVDVEGRCHTQATVVRFLCMPVLEHSVQDTIRWLQRDMHWTKQ